VSPREAIRSGFFDVETAPAAFLGGTDCEVRQSATRPAPIRTVRDVRNLRFQAGFDVVPADPPIGRLEWRLRRYPSPPSCAGAALGLSEIELDPSGKTLAE